VTAFISKKERSVNGAETVFKGEEKAYGWENPVASSVGSRILGITGFSE